MSRPGTHRYVFERKSFILKVPRIRILHFVYLVVRDDILRDHKRVWCKWKWFVEIVLAGLLENYREAHCYLNTRHHLLARLYLPLIFVNVYRREDGVGDFDFRPDQLAFEVSDSGDLEFSWALAPCSHTFDHVENFALSKGKVVILDFGEKGFENLLINHGDKVEQLLLSKAKQPL